MVRITKSQIEKLRKGVQMIIDIIDELDAMPAKNRFRQDAFEVLSYYQKVHPRKGRNVVAGHPSFKLIIARLKDGFSVSELNKAIDGNLKDEWHSSNPGGHGLTYVFRNQEKVERFIEVAGGKTPNKKGNHAGSKEFKHGKQRLDFD